MVDGQSAVVGAFAAVGKSGAEGQALDLLEGEHSAARALRGAFPRDQGCTESAHDAGDIGTDNLAVRDLFKRAKHSVIVEGSALDDDVLAELRGGGNLHDLEQRVLDDRIRQAGGNIGYLRAFLLGLLDTGIHEYGAPRAEVDRMFCKKRCLCKILDRIVQRLRKGFYKGSAA